ncbi:hypothetical protein IV203_028421 [Nitzschia inconspicua]|uniref:Uncharacterized protein n=1 Tax=Nitzschia inconspicua TaxID=303405 RepID=A0A9K3LRS3_9STRA|nr:hypothetical protein IV203_028421 [Nitzschia inconspicua]
MQVRIVGRWTKDLPALTTIRPILATGLPTMIPEGYTAVIRMTFSTGTPTGPTSPPVGRNFACQLGSVGDDDDHGHNNKVGTFVCRTTFHPITGEPFERVRCIPIDRAWETDVCGYCGGNCPNVTDSKASCLNRVSAKEEDNVIQFALGTSHRTSSSSLQLSSGGSSPMENGSGILSVVVTVGLGAIVLMLA